jgi:putative transcriptional regulator
MSFANAPRFLTGQLLLAMPSMGDTRFEKSVIAMCGHDEYGALGIAVHRQIPDVSLHGLLEQLDVPVEGVEDVPVFMGGPVEPQRGFVLHSLDWGGQETKDVAGKWGLSSTIDALRAIGRPHGPSRWLVALGYAGWGPGQLDNEMQRSGWHVADGDTAILFDMDADARWAAAWRSTGVNPHIISADIGHA